MATKRLLIAAPLVLDGVPAPVVVLGAELRAPDPRRTPIASPSSSRAPSATRSFLNPVLSADRRAGALDALVFDRLLDLDENLALRGEARRALGGERARLRSWCARRRALPDGAPATAATLRDADRGGARRDAARACASMPAAEHGASAATCSSRARTASRRRPRRIDVLRVPERIALELPQVRAGPRASELAPVLGPGYLAGFDAGALRRAARRARPARRAPRGAPRAAPGPRAQPGAHLPPAARRALPRRAPARRRRRALHLRGVHGSEEPLAARLGLRAGEGGRGRRPATPCASSTSGSSRRRSTSGRTTASCPSTSSTRRRSRARWTAAASPARRAESFGLRESEFGPRARSARAPSASSSGRATT